MTLRRAEQADWPALCELYSDVRRECFPWIDADTLRADDLRRDAEGEELFVVCNEREIAGFIAVWVPDRFIHHLFVRRASRRKGVASRLLDFIAHQYPPPLRLKCVCQNRDAVAFYEKRGWHVVGNGISGDGPYHLMELPRRTSRRTYGNFTPIR